MLRAGGYNLMCGIAGFQLGREAKARREELEAMGALLRHRGPDHFDTFIHDEVGLAHNRLSIVDLSPSAHQPFRNEHYALAFNGEIYNHSDLRQELTVKGAVFKSHSDTETLFFSLIYFGVEETLRRIKGMFAFAFYDVRQKRVYLCRDRYGIKPLFWTENEKGIFWASEIKALKAVCPVRLDPLKTLFSAAGAGDRSPSSTVFKDVQQVPPGSFFILEGGKKLSEKVFFNLLDDVDHQYYAELDRMSFSDAVEIFDGLLGRSVKRMLMSDVPMGSFVSGGVDSALIAFWAARHESRHQLFTSNVVGKYSEFEDAQMLSRIIGANLRSSEFRPEDMLARWAECTYHYECPIVTHTNAIPFSGVAMLAHASGVKSVLTGEGSDELFWGYPHLHWGKLRNILRSPLELSRKIYGLVPNLSGRVYDECYSIFPFLNQTVQSFEQERLEQACLEKYAFLGRKDSRLHSRTIQMMGDGLLSLLHRNDRMGMQASIESRFPFLDEEIVRFAVNLPARFKGGFTAEIFDMKHPFVMDKKIVRMAALKYLPRQIAFKRKEGFPMYGHRHLKVKDGYFHGGYMAGALGLSPEAQKFMCQKSPSYFLAKMISVDVFGRIFEAGQSVESVTKNLLDKVTLTV